MESPVRTRMSTTARAFAARLDVVTRLVPARREPGRGSLAGEWHRAESRARGMARGDHAQCPVDGSRTHQTIRTLGSGGTRRAAPAPAGEPRAGAHGRSVSKIPFVFVRGPDSRSAVDAQQARPKARSLLSRTDRLSTIAIRDFSIYHSNNRDADTVKYVLQAHHAAIEDRIGTSVSDRTF